MKIQPQQIKILISLCLFASAVFMAASWHVKAVQADYVAETQSKIEEQKVKLNALVLLTATEGADAEIREIIKDCSSVNRERFDTLLGKLATLTKTELNEVEQLFNACSRFYPERNAVMATRLQREYEAYLSFIELLAMTDSKTKNTNYNTQLWGDIVTLEVKRSDLNTALVEIQGRIIEALLEGAAIGGDQIQALLKEGQETKESLFLIAPQIDAVRSELSVL